MSFSARLPRVSPDVRLNTVFWYTWLSLIVLMGLAELYLGHVGIGIHWGVLFVVIFPYIVILGGTSLACLLVRPSWPTLFLFLQCMLLFLVSAIVLGVLSYMGATFGLPLADPIMIKVDRLFGFDWLTYVHWIGGHPALAILLTAAYNTIWSHAAWVLLLLAVTHRPRDMLRFVLSTVICAVLAIIVFVLLPVAGGYIYYDIHPESFGYNPSYARTYEHDLLALRGASLHTIVTIQGIIQFPSFHAGVGALTIWAARALKWWLPFAFCIAGLMIVATMADGGHYLADVIAGVLMALLSIPLANTALPKNI